MNERLLQIKNHSAFIPSVVGVLSFGAGAGVGYLISQHRSKSLYEVAEEFVKELVDDHPQFDFDAEPESRLLDHYIEETYDIERAYPSMSTNMKEVKRQLEASGINVEVDIEIDEEGERRPALVIDESVYNELATTQIVVTEEDVDDSISVNEEAPVLHSVFGEGNSTDEWVYEDEVAKRDDSPYVIHQDEYYSNEMDLTQQELVYYARDGILTDEQGRPIYNHGMIIGDLRFGHGSDNEDIFYVRNVKNKAEYQIIRTDASYSEEILGVEIEDNVRQSDLKHSDEPRKFRRE